MLHNGITRAGLAKIENANFDDRSTSGFFPGPVRWGPCLPWCTKIFAPPRLWKVEKRGREFFFPRPASRAVSHSESKPRNSACLATIAEGGQPERRRRLPELERLIMVNLRWRVGVDRAAQTQGVAASRQTDCNRQTCARIRTTMTEQTDGLRRRHLKGLASVWPMSDASFTATADERGGKVNPAKEQHSISHWKETKAYDQKFIGKDLDGKILLGEGR